MAERYLSISILESVGPESNYLVETDLDKLKSRTRLAVQEHMPRRCFVQENYLRKLKNDEKIERCKLIYSMRACNIPTSFAARVRTFTKQDSKESTQSLRNGVYLHNVLV
jgi:hypothetical protein